jgi:tetratricopeptide (TPR) repeat protein
MKMVKTYRNLTLTFLAVCFAVMGWAITRQRTGSQPSPAQTLAALPTSAGQSATDKQIEKWTAKARQDEKDPNAWNRLGDALMQKARETVDTAYYGHAERAYQQALASDPKSVDALVGMAWVNGGRHEFEKSIAWANRAIALDPKNKDAYGLLGDAAVEMGDYKAAYTHYQKMLDLKPDASSYSRGAHLLFLTGDVHKALFLMLKAIEAGSIYGENNAWCRAELAKMLFNNGNLVAAENTLEAALKKAPQNYHLLVGMGRVQAARKNYPAAIETYQQAIRVAPQLEAVIALSELYRLTGNSAEAEKQEALVETIHRLQKANGVLGDSVVARFYADRDRHLPEALRMAEEEYKTRKNVFVADTLAWCYYKNGRYDEAKETIEKALAQKTPEAGIAFHAGMIYAKLGRRALAQQYLYAAQSRNPNFSPTDAPVCAETLKALGSAPDGPQIAGKE